MNKSESIQEITKAVIKVMTEVKGIEKSMTIGTGNSSYKGVPDQEVKKIIGDSMAKNGLAIFPIGVNSITKVDRWEEIDSYSKIQGATKMKQSVFTESTVTYLLTHTSGEFIELSGYGHGVDSQDKSAGKATTYALKYTLLYTFLVPTGKIDDADTTHSEQIETPKKTPVKQVSEETQILIEQWEQKLKECKDKDSLAKVYNEGKVFINKTPSLYQIAATMRKEFLEKEQQPA